MGTKVSLRVKQCRAAQKQKLVACFGGRCGICKTVDHAVVFDFHHIDPSTKSFEISRKYRAWDVVVDEAKKCAMLCSNCHRKVHANLLDLPIDVPRLDLSLLPHTEVTTMDECPVCRSLKMIHNKTCSVTCSAKRREKIDWDAIPLVDWYAETSNISEISRRLGNVSDVTVKKKLVARGVSLR